MAMKRELMTEREDDPAATYKLIVERLLGSEQMHEIALHVEDRTNDVRISLSYEKGIFLEFSGSTIHLRISRRYIRMYERHSKLTSVVFSYDTWDRLFLWRWKVLAMCLIDFPRILAKSHRNLCIEIQDP